MRHLSLLSFLTRGDNDTSETGVQFLCDFFPLCNFAGVFYAGTVVIVTADVDQRGPRPKKTASVSVFTLQLFQRLHRSEPPKCSSAATNTSDVMYGYVVFISVFVPISSGPQHSSVTFCPYPQ